MNGITQTSCDKDPHHAGAGVDGLLVPGSKAKSWRKTPSVCKVQEIFHAVISGSSELPKLTHLLSILLPCLEFAN